MGSTQPKTIESKTEGPSQSKAGTGVIEKSFNSDKNLDTNAVGVTIDATTKVPENVVPQTVTSVTESFNTKTEIKGNYFGGKINL